MKRFWFKCKRFLRTLLHATVAPSERGKTRWIFFLVLLVTVFSASITAPDILNRGIEAVNGVLRTTVQRELPMLTQRPYHLGLDLLGGAHLVYEADMQNIGDADREDALEGVRDVIERRVNAFGVSEPIVQTTTKGDHWRLIVELAGVKDVDAAIQMIGETPLLEFKEENPQTTLPITDEEKKEIAEFNAKAEPRAKGLLQQVLKGDIDFLELIKNESDDSATKENGGDLGFIGKTGSPVSSVYDDIAAIGLGKIGKTLLKTDEG